MSVITGNVQSKLKWSYQYNNQLHWRWLITERLNHYVVNSTQSFKPPWGITIYSDTQVPRIRPLADIVHYKYIFTYLVTYLLATYTNL